MTMIRTASSTDYEDVRDMLFELSKQPKLSKLYPDLMISEEQFLPFVSDLRQRLCLISENDAGEVQGFSMFELGPLHHVHTPVASMVAVFIKPEARGQGIMKSFLDAFEYWGKTIGAAFYTVSVSNEAMLEKRDYERYEVLYIKKVD